MLHSPRAAWPQCQATFIPTTDTTSPASRPGCLSPDPRQRHPLACFRTLGGDSAGYCPTRPTAARAAAARLLVERRLADEFVRQDRRPEAGSDFCHQPRPRSPRRFIFAVRTLSTSSGQESSRCASTHALVRAAERAAAPGAGTEVVVQQRTCGRHHIRPRDSDSEQPRRPRFTARESARPTPPGPRRVPRKHEERVLITVFGHAKAFPGALRGSIRGSTKSTHHFRVSKNKISSARWMLQS